MTMIDHQLSRYRWPASTSHQACAFHVMQNYAKHWLRFLNNFVHILFSENISSSLSCIYVNSIRESKRKAFLFLLSSFFWKNLNKIQYKVKWYALFANDSKYFMIFFLLKYHIFTQTNRRHKLENLMTCLQCGHTVNSRIFSC
jgi:hypothetical protein